MERRVQLGYQLAIPESERIQVGILMATKTIGVDQLQNLDLLGISVGITDRSGIAGGIFGKAAEVISYLRMRLIRYVLFWHRQAVEDGLPLLGNRFRIRKISLIKVFYIGRIGTGQVRRIQPGLHYAIVHLYPFVMSRQGYCRSGRRVRAALAGGELSSRDD